MTPNDLEVLIHCHVSPAIHERMHASAVREAHEMLERVGLIEPGPLETKGYRTTDMGNAYMRLLLSTPIPTMQWLDHNGKVIEEMLE